jgi:hypothetical protein
MTRFLSNFILLVFLVANILKTSFTIASDAPNTLHNLWYCCARIFTRINIFIYSLNICILTYIGRHLQTYFMSHDFLVSERIFPLGRPRNVIRKTSLQSRVTFIDI